MSERRAARGAGPYRRTKVFISYRRSGNAGDAERLYDELRGYFPARHLFLDVKSIRRGDSWPNAVETALDSSRAFLAVIGPQWLASSDEQGRRRLEDPSDTLRREVSAALARGGLLIPVLLHGASMPAAEELPDELQRLAECQAVEIRSGHWGTDVRELVGILNRRFYRRRRLTVSSTLAAALVVVAALVYYRATVALPVSIKAGDPLGVLPVDARREVVVKGLAADGADILRYDGKPVADLSVDCYAGRFDEETVAKQSLDQKWAEGSAQVRYYGVDERLHSGDDEEPQQIIDEPVCSTSVAVRAAEDGAPSTLRFFQDADPDAATGYREISLSADQPLRVRMDVTKLSDKAGYGLGCRKQFEYGGNESRNKPEGDGGIVANADARLDFRFMPLPGDTVSPGTTFLTFKEAAERVKAFDLDATGLSAQSVKVRARGSEEIPCGDKQGRATVSFEATSADDKRPLRLRRLEVAANHFILAVEGDAHVTSMCEPVSPGVAERVRRDGGRALLLLTAAAGILIGLVYSVKRL